MGVKVIKYDQVTCDARQHEATKQLPNDAKYMYFKYSGLAICFDCWSRTTPAMVVKLFEIEMESKIVGQEYT
jgi:hypothetical protein